MVVVIAAGAFTFDAHHGLAIFLRTRVTGFWQLIAPRFTVNAAAAALAYVLGALAAWYETSLLIGAPAAGGMLAAMLCGAVYLGYAVAVTAFAATIAASTLATVGIALAVLFALPDRGRLSPHRRLAAQRPADAPAALLSGTHQLSHYLPAFAVTVAASAAARPRRRRSGCGPGRSDGSRYPPTSSTVPFCAMAPVSITDPNI